MRQDRRAGRRNTLVVFVREPVAGRVKTRLGAEIGAVAASWWYRHQVQRQLRVLGRDPRWVIRLAVTPDRAANRAWAWPSGLRRIPQGGGDLGARLRRALCRMAPGPVVIVGSDVPTMGRGAVASAFAALRAADWVLGPSPDGGFWAIGCRAMAAPLPADFLEGVRWSSAAARSDTEQQLVGRGRVAYLETLADVDRAADLRPSAAGHQRTSRPSSRRGRISTKLQGRCR